MTMYGVLSKRREQTTEKEVAELIELFRSSGAEATLKDILQPKNSLTVLRFRISQLKVSIAKYDSAILKPISELLCRRCIAAVRCDSRSQRGTVTS